MSLDFLKPVLGDELFAQVADKVKGSGINLVNIADGSYIPKAKFDEQLDKVKKLTTDLADRDEQIKQEQAKNATVDTLTAQIEQLKQDIAAKDGTIATMAMDYDIKDAVRASKPKDLDIVVGLLDREKISKKDGKLSGIEEQLKGLQESKSFLFEQEQSGGNRGGFDGRQDTGSGEGHNTNAAMNDALRAMAGRA